jgi:hypothetical protein
MNRLHPRLFRSTIWEDVCMSLLDQTPHRGSEAQPSVQRALFWIAYAVVALPLCMGTYVAPHIFESSLPGSRACARVELAPLVHGRDRRGTNIRGARPCVGGWELDAYAFMHPRHAATRTTRERRLAHVQTRRSNKRSRDDACIDMCDSDDDDADAATESRSAKMVRTGVPHERLAALLASGEVSMSARVGCIWCASCDPTAPNMSFECQIVPMVMLANRTGVIMPEDMHDTSGRVTAAFESTLGMDTASWMSSLQFVECTDPHALPLITITACFTFHLPGLPDAVVASTGSINKSISPDMGRAVVFSFASSRSVFGGELAFAPAPRATAASANGPLRPAHLRATLYFPPP